MLAQQRMRRVALSTCVVFIGVVVSGWLWWRDRDIKPLQTELSPQSPQYGGVYRRGFAGEPGTLDPHLVTSIYGASVVQQLFDGLVQFDAELNVVPSIAHSWEPSADGLVWTFYLRKDVKFHNGRAVVAKDFVYSFTRIMDPNIRSAAKSYFARVKGVRAFLAGQAKEIEGFKAIDDHTLQIVLSQPYAPLVRALGTWAMKVVPRAEVERPGDAFARAPIGTGAFRFVDWQPGQAITLEANETYFEKRPYLNSSRFVLIFLYDLCRKALSKPISCPRSRLECRLHSENRSEAWSLQLWVSIGVELRPR